MPGLDGVFDGGFGHTIVVMATNATVPDTLTLGGQFGGKFLQRVHPIVSTVGMHLDAGSGSFSLKTELSLDNLGPCETHLMDDN
jgi:hypothetical protein